MEWRAWSERVPCRTAPTPMRRGILNFQPLYRRLATLDYGVATTGRAGVYELLALLCRHVGLASSARRMPIWLRPKLRGSMIKLDFDIAHEFPGLAGGPYLDTAARGLLPRS